MTNFEEVILFGKKSFSSLLKDVVDNQKTTEKQITDLIIALKPFITTSGEAVMIVPLIAQYMEIKVKNDDSLVKLAAVVQRCMNNNSGGKSDFEISDEEKQLLLDGLNSIQTPTVPELKEGQKQIT